MIAVSDTGAALRLAASGKNRTWKDARVIGFVPRQDVERVLALTVRGLACPLDVPRARFSYADVVLLGEDDRIVSLLYLARPSQAAVWSGPGDGENMASSVAVV